MSDSKICAEVIWKIENFSYCWHENEEYVLSPMMCVDNLWGSMWYLKLYPRGCSSDGSDDVSLFLRRTQDSSKMKEIDIAWDFAVLDAENSPITDMIHDDFKSCSKKTGYGCKSLIKQNLLYEKEDVYIPGNVLTIGCTIWSKNMQMSDPAAFFFLRTRVPVNKCNFSWWTHKTFSINEESKICLSLPLRLESTVSVVLKQLCDQNKKHVQVCIDGDIETDYSWKCDIRTLDTGKEFLICSDKINRNSLPYEKKFQPLTLLPSTVDTIELKDFKRELKCEFAVISQYLELSQESRINYKSLSATSHTFSDPSKIINKTNKAENSLYHGLQKMYCDGLLSDFAVKVQDNCFPVHSVILAARSSVLSRMLETSMKESVDKTLELDDLDESIVHQMLDYMYTDDVGQLFSESAMKLYYAADKYDIPGLKNKTSYFLLSSISISSVCDILELADRHQDEHLKSAAVKFIFNNEIEMMSSNEYRNFSKQNPDLFFETTFNVAKLKNET